MSRFPDRLVSAALVGVVVALSASAASAGELGLGREALPEEVAAWDIDVRPDGQGLPEGSGTVAEGEEIFAERCAMCHGDFGEGLGRWPVLAGGKDTLASNDPVKTVGSYWPYLSTVYDYVYRAMPFGNAQSLTADETYAVVAYILYLNYLMDEDGTLGRDNFAGIRMPNEDGFFMDDRPDTPTLAQEEPCVTDCKDEVEIVKRARILDVTPEGKAVTAGITEDMSVGDPAGVPEGTGEGADTAGTGGSEQIASLDPDKAAHGAKVFRKCKSCHSVKAGVNRVGPSLHGVVGRSPGAAEGFSRYSDGMKELGGTWTEETLSAFLADPRGYVQGTTMSFAGLPDSDDRAAVIEFLKTQGGNSAD